MRWTEVSPGLVDDLVQNTFLKLCADNFKALREFEFRHEHALTGFLKVVASNVVRDHLRSSLSQKHGNGKAISAGLEETNGKIVYEVVIVKNGTTQKIVIDPANGQVSSS